MLLTFRSYILHLLLLFLYVCIWPPLLSSGQSSWLQIQESGFDSWRYQISREVVGLEQGPLSREYIEELLQRKSSGSGLENREYGRRDPSHWPRGTLYPQKLALTSPTRGGPSAGIVRSRTQTTEFSFFSIYIYIYMSSCFENRTGERSPISILFHLHLFFPNRMLHTHVNPTTYTLRPWWSMQHAAAKGRQLRPPAQGVTTREQNWYEYADRGKAMLHPHAC
jgi:hypothetical protein